MFTLSLSFLAMGQREYNEIVRFEIPIGATEENAKSIIKKHNYSIYDVMDEGEIHHVQYQGHGGHRVSIGLVDGKVIGITWQYDLYSYSSAERKRDAIILYFEEDLGYIASYTVGQVMFNDFLYNGKKQICILSDVQYRKEANAFSGQVRNTGVYLQLIIFSKQYLQDIATRKKEAEDKEKQEGFERAIADARMYASNGKYEDAISKYNEAIAILPDKQDEYESELEMCKHSLAEQKKEEQFGTLIKEARERQQKEDYTLALSKYDEALKLYPDRDKKYKSEIDECRSGFNYKQGEHFLSLYQYSMAREYYKNALQLTTTNKQAIIARISYVDEVERFDMERKDSVYNYMTLDEKSYAQAIRKIEELILEYAKKNDLKPCTVTVSYSHSISGYETKEVNVSPENYSLKSHLSTNAPSLPVCEKYGLKLATTATIQIPVESVEMKTFTAKRKYNGIKTDESLRTETSSQMTNPGRYNVGVTTTCINGKYNSFQRLLSYKNTGGPSNALWSVLVPGLGQHKVTYGENSGVWTTVGVYGLIAGGIGFYLYSNSEYDKYHQATTQADMDKHFENAQGLRGFAYATLAGAAAWWIYDIVDVYLQGKKNNDKYGNGRAYVSYLPQNNALGIGYTLNF